MKVQKIKTNKIGSTENIKPYIVIGVGVLIIAVSVYQLLAGAPGNLLQSRADKKASQEAAKPGSTKENAEQLVVENIDSDSDGLTDTEEERIYHTDPVKPDTDGDTYKDGDEVKTGHDPLVNESGNKSSTQSATAVSSQEYNRFIATTPDDLSKIDPTKYLDDTTLQDLNSGNPSSQSIDKLASLALSNAAISQTQGLPAVPDSALNITSASGKAAVQQYLLSLSSVLLPLVPFTNPQEMTDYLVAAMGGDSTKAQTLVAVAKKAEDQLKALPVPNELVEVHKKIIGIVQTFQQSTTVLLNSDAVDSETGMVATNQLRIIGNASQDLLATFKDIMNKYNITSLGF